MRVSTTEEISDLICKKNPAFKAGFFYVMHLNLINNQHRVSVGEEVVFFLNGNLISFHR